MYTADLPSQTRGTPILSSILNRLKTLDQWEDTTLESALQQASVAAIIESEMPDAGQIAGAGPQAMMNGLSPATQYFDEQTTFMAQNEIYFDGSRVHRLYPGEKFSLASPNQPVQNFADFEDAMLKHIAIALGVSAAQLTHDYKNVSLDGITAMQNQSSAFHEKQRVRLVSHAAQVMAEAWLEEQICNGRLPLPERIQQTVSTKRQRLTYFMRNKPALCKSDWFGPAIKPTDELRSAKTAAIELQLGLKSGEKHMAERGEDWSELQERLVYEDIVAAANRKKARERAEDMGCLPEYEEIQSLKQGGIILPPEGSDSGESNEQ